MGCLSKSNLGRAGQSRLLLCAVLICVWGGMCDVTPIADTSAPLKDNGQTIVQSAVQVEEEEVLGYTPQLPLAQANSKPSGLVLVSTPPNEVELTWVDNSDDETGFTIQRNANYAGWTDLVTLEANQTRYVDATVQPKGRYGYRVVAFNAAQSRTSLAGWILMPAAEDMTDTETTEEQTSGTSSTAGTRPAMPTGLKIALTTGGQVQLTWTDAATNETGFEILRYSSGSGWAVLVQVGADTAEYVDTTAEATKSYCYRVRAFNDRGYSSSAAPKCVAVPASNGPTDDDTDPEDGCPGGDCPPAATGPKVVPWMELTAPFLNVEKTWSGWLPIEGADSATTLDVFCVRSLEYWGRVADAAIITTHPENLRNGFTDADKVRHLPPLEYVMANRPAGMTIYGGVSTYSLPGAQPDCYDTRPYDFADAEGWLYITEEARYITRVTGNNVVVFENETALTPFHLGEATIDLEKLAQSLTPLRETGIETWWYLPAIARNSKEVPDLQQRTIDLLNTISTALPNCRFIVGYVGRLDWRQNARAEVTRRQMMIDMFGQSRILDYMTVTRDGYWHWDEVTSLYYHTSQTAFSDIGNLPGVDAVCVYPDPMSWVTVAREFAEGYSPNP